MVSETPSRVTNRSGDGSKEATIGREKNGEKAEIFLSPRFKSAAAMAGWDEEDLISFVVDDTPERSSSKRRRRSNLLFKTTPPSSSSSRRLTKILIFFQYGSSDFEKLLIFGYYGYIWEMGLLKFLQFFLSFWIPGSSGLSTVLFRYLLLILMK